jgi:hypothetical protein
MEIILRDILPFWAAVKSFKDASAIMGGFLVRYRKTTLASIKAFFI